jgi:glucosamine--fructose-6-phosphate aminotransferase (isomerizing)
MAQHPRWATTMMARHPGEAFPTRAEPIPAWLEAEAEQVPLWYIIRESDGVRTEHPFLLYQEILRQPDQWDEVLSTMGQQIEAVAARIVAAGIDQVIVTGCGSAFFTSIHGEFTIPRLAGLPARAIESFELLHYFPAVNPASTLVIAHSGTGGSIETIEALQSARDLGCLTLAICNTEDSAVVTAAELALVYTTHQACGPCISVVSTRILIATLLAESIARQSGRRGLPAVSESLKEVPAVSRDFLATQESLIRELAVQYAGIESVLLVGSGANYFSAREGTLKIEEQAVFVGKAYRTGDFHHDALSVVGPSRLVIGIEIGGDGNERMEDVLMAANEAGSPTIAVTWSGTAGADALARIADHEIRLSGGLPELLVPIAMTPVFQLLGYYLGVERGFNPDTLRTDHLPNARAWLTAFPLGTH